MGSEMCIRDSSTLARPRANGCACVDGACAAGASGIGHACRGTATDAATGRKPARDEARTHEQAPSLLQAREAATDDTDTLAHEDDDEAFAAAPQPRRAALSNKAKGEQGGCLVS